MFSVLLILLIPVAGASATVPRNPDRSEEARATTLPFDGTNDLIIVKATINDKGPFSFVLDTGASDHLITPQIAQSLGLRIEGSMFVDTGGPKMMSAGITKVSELRIGNFTLENQTFAVGPLPASYPFQGFIGAELFKHFVVRIDFRQSLVTLSTPNARTYRDTGVAIPIKFHQGLIPQVKAQVDGVRGWFKLDTGYNGSLALFRQFVDQHNLLSKYTPRNSGAGARTLTEDMSDLLVAQIHEFQIGGLKLPEIPADLYREKEGSNSIYAGGIGTGILKRFKVIINYQGKYLALEANEAH